MKQMNQRVKGYFTVEATLIFPMVLFVILFVIYTALFMYNRCILEQDIKIALLRASNQWSYTEDEVKESIYNNSLNCETQEVIAIKSMKFDVRLNKDEIIIQTDTAANTALSGGWNILKPTSKWGFHTQFKTERYDPALFLRNCRKVEYIAKRISK